MVEPTIVPRSAHPISRRQIDPDALKVLYRLHEHNYVAYLVGGSVRDLLLDRRPKDFDIGTSAHPHQVKKLFRNCWIIGRRFRLAHVKFGTKTIEVARSGARSTPHHARSGDRGSRTGRAERRRGAAAVDDDRRRTSTRAGSARSPDPARQHLRHPRRRRLPPGLHGQRALLRHRTFSIIDYVGGLEDLHARTDPLHRRSGRALPRRSGPHAARGGARGAARVHHRRPDPRVDREPQARDRAQRPARLLEEYFKILRSGHAAEAFGQLHATGLLKEITPELDDRPIRCGARSPRSIAIARSSRARPTR